MLVWKLPVSTGQGTTLAPSAGSQRAGTVTVAGNSSAGEVPTATSSVLLVGRRPPPGDFLSSSSTTNAPRADTGGSHFLRLGGPGLRVVATDLQVDGSPQDCISTQAEADSDDVGVATAGPSGGSGNAKRPTRSTVTLANPGQGSPGPATDAAATNVSILCKPRADSHGSGMGSTTSSAVQPSLTGITGTNATVAIKFAPTPALPRAVEGSATPTLSRSRLPSLDRLACEVTILLFDDYCLAFVKTH